MAKVDVAKINSDLLASPLGRSSVTLPIRFPSPIRMDGSLLY